MTGGVLGTSVGVEGDIGLAEFECTAPGYPLPPWWIFSNLLSSMVGLARPPSQGLRRAGKPVLGNSSKAGVPAFQTSFSNFSHIV